MQALTQEQAERAALLLAAVGVRTCGDAFYAENRSRLLGATASAGDGRIQSAIQRKI